MPNVVLKANEQSSTFGLSKYTINEEQYVYSHLFKRYEHKPQSQLETGPFVIYKDYDDGIDKKATYSNLGEYSKASLDKAHVYYSIFDDKLNNPLILVLFFKGIPNPKHRYYLRSVFEVEIASNVSKDLGDLEQYVSEKKLLEVLLYEIDSIPDILSYHTDTITADRYNNNKINVTKDKVKGQSDRSSGFTKYTHQPSGSRVSNKACVLYKKQFLTRLNVSGSHEKPEQIREVQGITIHTMVVYYSGKIDEPLMICIVTEERSRREQIYYFLKVHNGLYWEKMDHKSYNLLLGKHLGSKDIHNTLTANGNELLISALLKLEHNLTKILVIIVDKTIGYSNSEVTNTFKSAHFDTEHFRFVNNLGIIPVNISTESKTLEDIGYKLYEHDLTPISKSLQPGESLRLTFIRSEFESIGQDSKFLTIDLDYQPEYGAYNSQSREILVSNAYSLKHNYKWFRHACQHEIFARTFRIRFDGQYITIDGDLRPSPKLVIAYFLSNFRDRFILIAFSDEGSKKIWYMTYSKFREIILKRSSVKLSQLEQMTADTKTTNMKGGAGYVIDESIVTKLQEEYIKIKSDTDGTVNNLCYEVGQEKLYVYLFNDSRVLMICYNNKAYTRYFLGKKYSRWKLVDGINSCICKSNLGLRDSSYKNLVKSLDDVAFTFRLIRPEELAEKEVSEKSITIDISREASIIYSFGKVSVTSSVYDNCNIFRYYSHTPTKKEALNISSLTTATSQGKTIKFKDQITDFISANVYFATNYTKKPIILEIVSGGSTRKYYKDFDKLGEHDTISESSDITSNNLADKLIEESERINGTVIYQIDKTITDTSITCNYGHGNSITVRKEPKKNSGFTSYKHTSKTSSNKSYILFQKKLLVGRSDTGPEDLRGVQDKPYSYIKVYIFDNDRSLPLLIELKEPNNTFQYSHKNDENGSHWDKESAVLKVDDKIKTKLDSLYYEFKKSAIIEIDKGINTTRGDVLNYPIKLIDNKLKGLGKTIETNYTYGNDMAPNKNITVSQYSRVFDSRRRTYSDFNRVNHEIRHSTLSAEDKKSIGGFRLYITKIGDSVPSEVKLYNQNSVRTSQERDRDYFHYSFRTEQQGKIFIYFYGEDTRPLAIRYNNKVYKRKDDEGIEWVYAGIATSPDSHNILGILTNVYREIKRKLVLVNTGEEKNIKALTGQTVGKPDGIFTKDTFTPDTSKTTSGPYKLHISSLTKGINSHTVLTKLLNTLNSQSFDKVNKYYRDKSSPLLLEFVGDTTNINFVRIDDVKHWIKESIQNPEDDLEKIETNAKQTIVYGVDETDIKYNYNITTNHKSNHPTSGFNKYIHTPKNKKWIKSLFLHEGRKLMKKGNTESLEELNEINEITYDSVTVYFGTKAKVGNSFSPLILELNKPTKTKNHYRFKLKDYSSYWEPLTIASKDVKDKDLITKLRETELDLVESLVILIEKTGVATYGGTEIQKMKVTPKEIKLAHMESTCISVNDTSTKAKCITNFGYKIYEHNVRSCLKEGKNYALRFFIFTGDSADKYNEIHLYDSDEALDILYCDTSGIDVKTKVCVYFYGDKDPRPLLLCVNGDAYKAKDINSYFEKWYKVANIKKCQCQNDSDNTDLVSSLTEVSKFLNVVNLERRPVIRFQDDEKPNAPGTDDHEYSVQKIKGNDIYIKVTYENKKCYRVYTHQPNGNDNKGDGFRLGSIHYNGKPTGINYESSDPLSTVSVYYSVHDGEHKHPFLVILKFKNVNREQYYKLKEKDAKEWTKMDEEGSDKDIITKLRDRDKIEDGLYDLRRQLGIYFDKNKITPLFKTDQCDDPEPNIAAIAGGTVGAAAVIGTGITIGVVVTKKLAVTAVTTVAAAAAAAAAA